MGVSLACALYIASPFEDLPMSLEPLPQLLTKSDLTTRLNISLRTIENMVKAGDFPPPVRIGKYVYWSEVAVTRWRQKLFTDQENWRQ